jgi:hypothetical protein
MFSCDYNGWADVPEEEREAIDAFEVALRMPVTTEWVALVMEGSPDRLQALPERLAA